MITLTRGKKAAMDRLSTKDGIISALAIDQRGALKKMIKALNVELNDEQIERFKELVSSELTPYASSILLDPEYGLPAASARHEDAGLLLAYEKTGSTNRAQRFGVRSGRLWKSFSMTPAPPTMVSFSSKTTYH